MAPACNLPPLRHGQCRSVSSPAENAITRYREAVVPYYKLTELGLDTEAVRAALDNADLKWLEAENSLDQTRGVLVDVPSDNFLWRWFGAGNWVRIIKGGVFYDLSDSKPGVQKVAPILMEAGLIVEVDGLGRSLDTDRAQT